MSRGGQNVLAGEKIQRIHELKELGYTHEKISKELSISGSTVSKWLAMPRPADSMRYIVPPSEQETKKVGEFDLDEWLDWMESGKQLKTKASWSQNEAAIKLGDGKEPQVLLQLGDTHIASWGTDHSLVRNVIREINETPNLWVILMGDLVQMSIKMRSVLEMSDNILPPEQQCMFLEKLLEKIQDKIAFSSWRNHGVEREEKQSGISMVKNLLSRRSIYFNGIGHPDVQVGEEIYRIACSHRFKGGSMYDANFAGKRYARMEANDREILLEADRHRFAISEYNEGGKFRLAMNNGSYQINSGYASRYHSLRTCPMMPSLVLYPDQHLFTGHRNLALALKSIGQ